MDANNKSTTFDYDLNGNQTKVTYPNGNTVEQRYNAVNRPTSVSHNGTDRYTFEYDPNGNITKETDVANNRVTSYQYDADNKLKTVQVPGNQTDYTYDKNGNVLERKYTWTEGTGSTQNSYNSLNQLTNIKEDATINVGSFSYNESDQLAGRRIADGSSTVYQYNDAGELVHQITTDKFGTSIDNSQYNYDNKGNIISAISTAGTTTYVYDELDQLLKETRPDGTIYEYTYDEVGNRLTKKVTTDGNAVTTSYTYDDADQLTSVNGTTYSYDDNGNLLSDGNRTYTYDAENRLTAVKDKAGATIASYTYRADGMRQTMTTPAKGTITFHYDENKNVVFETNASNTVIARYTYNSENQPVSMKTNGQYYYYQLNGHGDVVALTDASGVKVATYDYDAFGNLVAETGTVDNPYRYAGYRYDQETGLYYLQSRYYNSEIGRFVTRDTFDGFDDEPLSLNKYAYGHNNPVMKVDRDGHHPHAIIAGHVLRAAYGAFLYTVAYMYYQNVRYGRKFTKSAFISNFKSSFVWNLLFGFGVPKFLKSHVNRAGSWLGARFYSTAYHTVYRLKKKTVSYYVVYQIVRNILR